MPPAFALSQDQTLRFIPNLSPPHGNKKPETNRPNPFGSSPPVIHQSHSRRTNKQQKEKHPKRTVTHQKDTVSKTPQMINRQDQANPKTPTTNQQSRPMINLTVNHRTAQGRRQRIPS
jgi:hypothetical protein